MIHDLKIEYNYLDNLLSGKKRAEIRYNDRDYQKGDLLRFKDYRQNDGVKIHLFEILHVHSGLGLKEGYVVLSIRNIE